MICRNLLNRKTLQLLNVIRNDNTDVPISRASKQPAIAGPSKIVDCAIVGVTNHSERFGLLCRVKQYLIDSANSEDHLVR